MIWQAVARSRTCAGKTDPPGWTATACFATDQRCACVVSLNVLAPPCGSPTSVTPLFGHDAVSRTLLWGALWRQGHELLSQRLECLEPDVWLVRTRFATSTHEIAAAYRRSRAATLAPVNESTQITLGWGENYPLDESLLMCGTGPGAT